jgi:hypothetical protein
MAKKPKPKHDCRMPGPVPGHCSRHVLTDNVTPIERFFGTGPTPTAKGKGKAKGARKRKAK